MKMITTWIALLFLGGITAYGSSILPMDGFWRYDYNRSYIFVEGGVEFAVYPDGQFDFAYVGGNRGRLNVDYYNSGLNISFNSGYNYDMYVQYDDYGAVIQVENIPIYYDHFGRIVRAGNVDIQYANRRIVRVGGMNIFYDRWGYFSYYTGYISPWYRFYIYRPWHVYYARPFYNSCIVYDYPYRRYYNPYRYEYNYHRRNYLNRGRSSYANGRRSFHKPGSRVHFKDGRVARNKDYREGRENTMIDRKDRPARSDRYDRGDAKTRPVASNRGDRVDRKDRPVSDSRIERGNRNTRPVAKVDKNKQNRMRPAVDRNERRNQVDRRDARVNSQSNRFGNGRTAENVSRPNVKKNNATRSGSNSRSRVTTPRNDRNSSSRVSSNSNRSKQKARSKARSTASSERSSNKTRSSRGKKL
ncbi:hypothetical protein [Aureitalea marina]|nr:hypothetical protein [Aureitalea marina]